MKRKCVVLVAILLTVSLDLAFSQVSKTKIKEFVFNHINESLYIYEDGKDPYRQNFNWKKPDPFIIARNERFIISVIINPFTTTCKAGDITKFKSEDYKEAKKFADALGTLLPILGHPSNITENKTDTTSSVGENRARAEKQNAETKVPSESDAINRNLTELRSNLEILKKYLTEISDMQPSKLLDIQKMVSKWSDNKSVAALKKEIEDNFKKLDESMVAYSNILINSENAVDTTSLFLVVRTQSQLTKKADIEKMLDKLMDFQKKYELINFSPENPKEIGYKVTLIDEILYNESEIQKTILTFSGIEEQESKNAQKVELTFEPKSKHSLKFAPAFVWSFVKKREFSTEKTEGGFKIIADDNETGFFGANVAAMLIITPKFAEDWFLSYVEIGINPIKDKIALFAGLGYEFPTLFSVGFGVTAQQIDKLGDGLKVGDILATEEAFKNNKIFKLGIYLRITLTSK